MVRGFIDALPLALGVAAYGFPFGILAVQAGFDAWSAGVMGIVVFAGASQIVAVERLVADAGILAAVTAGLALNLRYVAMLASLQPVLATAPRWLWPVSVHLTADENWALTLAKRARLGERIGVIYLTGAGLAVLLSWSGASALGALLAVDLPSSGTVALDFAFVAAFIAMGFGMWRGQGDLLTWIATAVAAAVLCQVLPQTSLAVILSALIGTGVAVLSARGRTGDGHER